MPITGSNDFSSRLSSFSTVLRGILRRFSGASLTNETSFDLEVSGSPDGWEVSCDIQPAPGQPDAFDLTTHFKLRDGFSPETAVGVQLVLNGWSPDNYVLMPAAVYNGNRFDARPMKYPPILKNPADIGPHVPTLISDVPRLNTGAGLSRIQQLTRDLATPAVGLYDTRRSKGMWLLTEQVTHLGDSGFSLEENEDRSQAVLTVCAPGVRIDERYTMANTHFPSPDRGADFIPGDQVEIRLRLFLFDCPRLQALFARFVDIRKDMAGEIRRVDMLPFSAAARILEDKYNNYNWDETWGYYSVGGRDAFLYSHWQVGWVGGLMSTHPLIAAGAPLSRERAMRTFDFVFPRGQAPSGFLHGCGMEGEWFGDNFDDTSKPWLLIRKNSDALYFILKQFLLLRQQAPSFTLPQPWITGTRALADAFVRLWRSYGQFGQFVNVQTGEIVVGNSASASTAPAGLALASQFFDQPEYLRIAEESARFLYDQFVKKGYSTGGPGEILQCPDSESAFGLLESFVVLFEVTGKQEWLEKACEQAGQCFTWCVSYDFNFPPESTFGQLDMRTAGSVYANVQNKHSAPGICTLSGDSLLKLFRATGDQRYLELIQEMAHNLPQYLSRADRPVGGMPPGWMNERVEMSDWLEPVGEIFYGSCWCEVSLMLAAVELPGLYIQTDTGLVCPIDHIQAVITAESAGRLVCELHNPTAFEATVRILSESSAQARTPLGQNRILLCPTVRIPPGASVLWETMR